MTLTTRNKLHTTLDAFGWREGSLGAVWFSLLPGMRGGFYMAATHVQTLRVWSRDAE